MNLFYKCTGLIDASELKFPNKVVRDCYYSMFRECTSLTKAPDLPALKLEINCYESMFNGCTALTTAPELPSTILASGCY